MLEFAAASVPALWLLIHFHKKDAYPEPTHLVVKTFLLGCLTVVPLLLFAGPILDHLRTINDPLHRAAEMAFLYAALPEELLKWMVVWFFCVRLSDFDEPMDGFVYGATASLGFAALENIVYVSQGGMSIAVLRAFTAVPAHAFFGAIMGYYIAKAVFTDPEHRVRHLALSLLIPIALHGTYNVGPLYLMMAADMGLTVSGPTALFATCTFLSTLIGMGLWVRQLMGKAVELQAEEDLD